MCGLVGGDKVTKQELCQNRQRLYLTRPLISLFLNKLKLVELAYSLLEKGQSLCNVEQMQLDYGAMVKKWNNM